MRKAPVTDLQFYQALGKFQMSFEATLMANDIESCAMLAPSYEILLNHNYDNVERCKVAEPILKKYSDWYFETIGV